MCKSLLKYTKAGKAKAGGVASAAPGAAVTDQRAIDKNMARQGSGGSYFSGAQFGQMTGGGSDFRISLFQKV